MAIPGQGEFFHRDNSNDVSRSIVALYLVLPFLLALQKCPTLLRFYLILCVFALTHNKGAINLHTESIPLAKAERSCQCSNVTRRLLCLSCSKLFSEALHSPCS